MNSNFVPYLLFFPANQKKKMASIKVHAKIKRYFIRFLRQSLKKNTFRVKLSDSIFFLLGLSPIVKLIWHEKQIFLSILCGKYCLIHLEIVKRLKKGNYNV